MIMKNSLIVTVIFLCIACSSSDEDINPSSFQVTVSQDVTTPVIDQVVTLTATANQPISEISYSTDNGATFPRSYGRAFGDTANLYFSFETLGSKTIIFRVKNEAGDRVDNTVTLNVERGGAVKMKQVQLNSFYNMGSTWDSEYPASNPNHLADVYFAFLKPPLSVIDGTRETVPTYSWFWYRSETRENEANLNWDIQNEDLYFNPEILTLYISFADDDGEGNLPGDLMLGPPFERAIPINNYIDSQPSTITVDEPDINLNYIVTIDWGQ